MAGLKKTPAEKTTSPNVVLVIFLVFFVLVAIGLGIWGYYGYAGQDDLQTKKRSAEAQAKAEKLAKEYYSMLYRHLRGAVGDKLDKSEEEQMKADFEQFINTDGGKFKDEKTLAADRKVIETLQALELLGATDDKRDYKTDFPKEIKTLRDKVKALEATTDTATKNKTQYDAFLKAYRDKQDQHIADANKRIADDNAKQTAIVQQKSDESKKFIANNMELIEQLRVRDEEYQKLKEDHNNEIKMLTRKIKVLDEERKDLLAGGGGGGAAAPTRSLGTEFPLMLDITPGRALWDNPVGRIRTVDLDLRQVTINLGSNHGIKPEVTFNVFGTNASGRAEGMLKGTIEVVKVEASTSLCRITSLYDAEGREILMALRTRNRLQRETENAMRDGDLLYNLFWGTRVAIIGYVSVMGEPSENPAEQVRQTNDFITLLRRNGMEVDAYVDLQDGQQRGKITSKTRFLIQGDPLRSTAKAKADDDKDKEGALDRNDLVNKTSLALRNDAKDRGLLMISAENFAVVTGFRKTRSANVAEVSILRSGFPGLPVAGAPTAGVLSLPGNQPRDDAKKDEMPKKDN